MHRLIYISLFALLTSSLFAQSFSKIDLSLQSGLSIPLFEYAAKNLQDGSFAMPGFTVAGELSTNLRFNGGEKSANGNNNTGIFVQSGLTLNPIDVGYLGYEKMQADPFITKLFIRSEPFKVIHLLGGVSYNYPLFTKVNLQGQLGAGVFFSSTPYQLYKPEYFPFGPPYFEITPSKDISFAYTAGLRAIYETNPWYQIALSA
ncbi:MAG: hypothetical protein ACM3ME_03345, partial [Chloroflexota bacterium]